MWVDRTDVTQLAQRVRLGPRELAIAIGGPWHVALREEAQESSVPGTLFVGRAGPSVGIVVGDEPDPRVLLGPVTGRWAGLTDLRWQVAVEAELTVPPREAATDEVDAFMRALGETVESIAAATSGRLVTCRHCGRLVAPALTVGEDTCDACGSTILGIQR